MPLKKLDGGFEYTSAADAAFIKAFTEAGGNFAEIMRTQIPKAVFGETPSARSLAKSVLKRAASDTTQDMLLSSKQWLHSTDGLQEAFIIGQKGAATSIGVEFGGPNYQLIDALKQSVAGDLTSAAYSVNDLLTINLQKATATATKLEDEQAKKSLAQGFDESVTRSLITSAEQEKVGRAATNDLLMDLGLKNGDQVFFKSGYRMEAGNYAELLTRTRSMEAINQGKASTYLENGYKFIETNEHDGVNENDICYELQGRVWALAPNDQDIPMLPEEWGLPPWHPNCVHSFSVWNDEHKTDEQVQDVVDDHSDDDKQLAEYK